MKEPLSLKLIQSASDLKAMPNIDFDENNHIYRKSNIRLPSVTQLMKVLSDDLYDNIDPAVLEKAAKRGTAVHEACEMFDKFNFVGIDENEREYFNAYLNFKKEHKVKSIANEIKVFHKQLLYAGTIDVIAEIDGKITLADIKTTAVLHSKLVAVQLGAYLMALKSHGLNVEQCAVVQLKSSGEYLYKIIEPDFDTFKACIQIQAFKNRKGE